MGKAELISAAVLSIQGAQTQALSDGLGGVYDAGLADGVASVPPPDADEQAKIDAAVATAVAPLNQQISDLTAKDAGDVQALSDAQAAMADLQSKFDALSGKESVEAGVISGLQGSLASLQAAVATLAGLVPPVAPASLK